MLSKLYQISRLDWMLFFSVVVVVSLVYSPFVLSIGMIGLLVTALLEKKDSERGFPLKFRTSLRQEWQHFWRKPIFWVPTIFFFLPLIGGFYSEDWNYLFRRLKLKLPLLLLPFAFFVLPNIERKHYLGLYYFLVALLSITCIGIGINYLLHFDAINELILKGQSIPVPRNHIRFSLMMAIGIVAGFYLWIEKFVWKYKWERNLILGMTIFLFVFIHILSVRSGLLVLYLTIGVLLLQYIVNSRRFGLGLMGLVLLLGTPMLAYFMIPSFKAKIDYARWDAKMYLEGTGSEYSDSERMLSYQIGWSIVKENPIFGVGTGDLKQEVKQRYLQQFEPDKKYKMPHNQLLSVWAAHGLCGLQVFLWAYFYLLFKNKNYQNGLFLSFMLIIFLSFMMENTIENSIGLGIFAFFLLWNLKYSWFLKIL